MGARRRKPQDTMTARPQNTIAEPVTMSGVGLHTGEETAVTVYPSREDCGVIFRRRDLIEKGTAPDHATIPATPDAVSAVTLGTTIQNTHGASVATIEHLMAALAICGVDHVLIDVSGPELPILDGSALPFLEALDAAGPVNLDASPAPVVSIPAFEARLEDRYIRFEPADARRLDVAIDFEDAAIGAQSVSLDLEDRRALRQRLAPARTFCRLADVDAMKAAGLSRGGSLENAIVVDQGRILNAGPLRDPNEFALHKALDLIGDLHLLGAPLAGKITAFKPGHDLNTRFAKAAAARRERANGPEAAVLAHADGGV